MPPYWRTRTLAITTRRRWSGRVSFVEESTFDLELQTRSFATRPSYSKRQGTHIAVTIAVLASVLLGPRASGQCAGDCDNDGGVTIDELVTIVNLSTNEGSLGALCLNAETTLDDRIDVTDVVFSLPSALFGCRIEGAGCIAPLAPITLEQLFIETFDRSIEVRPGTQMKLEVFAERCCYFADPVGACVHWIIEPPIGASISADGFLSIDPSTAPGSVYSVTADIENGRRTLSKGVYVHTRDSNPLVGYWQEVSQLHCGTGEAFVPDDLINELRFGADGWFDVTWYPFELYEDYWGRYSFDLSRNTIEFNVAWGNHVPDGIDGIGRVRFTADGNLVLDDVWLGVPAGKTSPPSCGHVFVRRA